MDAFEKLLRKYRTSRFLVVDPEGGMGDQLILLGLEKKLQELNIQYRTLKIRKSPVTNKAVTRAVDSVPGIQRIIRATRPGVVESHFRQLTRLRGEISTSDRGLSEEVILLRGGAYLNDIWKGYGVIHSVSKVVRNKQGIIIIIAPHSFYFDNAQFPNILAGITQEVHVFCREMASYNLISSFQKRKNVHIHLSPDTAFYLSKNDFHVQNKRKEYILIAPRLDRESIVTWKMNKIRKLWRMPTVVKDVNLLPDFRSFVDIVANASKVYTDRLHVAILSTILSKETHLFPNSYHKNRSVYEFSLKRFHNVKFIDANEFPESPRSSKGQLYH